MLKYREFLNLTDEEIVFIMREIFPHASRIDNVQRDEKWQRITVDVYLMEEESDFADEIDLEANGMMTTHDFEITAGEEWKFKQFLLAKGCDERLKDNPYLEDNVVSDKDEKEVLRNLLEKMKECNLFCGKYDAKNGSEKFMHGINTVMEYLAYQVSEEYCDEFSDMFMDNMIESEKKAKRK